MQSQVKMVIQKNRVSPCNCFTCQFDGLQGRRTLVFRGKEYCTSNKQYEDLKKYMDQNY